MRKKVIKLFLLWVVSDLQTNYKRVLTNARHILDEFSMFWHIYETLSTYCLCAFPTTTSCEEITE